MCTLILDGLELAYFKVIRMAQFRTTPKTGTVRIVRSRSIQVGYPIIYPAYHPVCHVWSADVNLTLTVGCTQEDLLLTAQRTAHHEINNDRDESSGQAEWPLTCEVDASNYVMIARK